MYIESDRPTGIAVPVVGIEVTTADARHAATPLDYETWVREHGQTRIKGFDASGASIVITIDNTLLWEMACGPLDHGRPQETR